MMVSIYSLIYKIQYVFNVSLCRTILLEFIIVAITADDIPWIFLSDIDHVYIVMNILLISHFLHEG
jgi:hypothetical protein